MDELTGRGKECLQIVQACLHTSNFVPVTKNSRHHRITYLYTLTDISQHGTWLISERFNEGSSETGLLPYRREKLSSFIAAGRSGPAMLVQMKRQAELSEIIYQNS